MRVPLVKLGSFLLLCARPFVPVGALHAEDYKVERPDFCQVDERFGKLPGQGKYHCAPTSVANHLYELRKEFPNLISSKDPTLKDLIEIITILSSSDYMNTIDGEGTYTSGLIKGLEKYVKEKGYDISIKYKGSDKDELYFAGSQITTNWIKEELKNGSNLVLSVDFYNKDEDGNCESIGAHSVTVVGFNDDSGFKLYIHDPAKRSGIEPTTEVCDLVTCPNGALEIQGLKPKNGSNIAFIGSVIAFKIEEIKKEKN